MSDGLSRRSFLKVATAAGAAAAIPGCEPAARKLIPYVIPDENVIPGVSSYYSSTCTECGAGCGVVASVREGRTIKLEGNPKDPISQGSICPRGQAALQGVYNPDRLPHPQVRGSDGRVRNVSWDNALKLFNGHLASAAKAGNDRIAYLGRSHGPTLDKITKLWISAWKSSKAVFYEPLTDQPARIATKLCFGREDLPVYRLDQAEAIVSFGAEFLETWGAPLENSRQYAAFRAPKERRGSLTIGRSAYVGPRMGITAAKSDEWVAAKPEHQATIAMGVLHVLVKQGWISPNSGFDIGTLRTFVAGYDPATVSGKTGVPADTITRLGQMFGQAESAVALAAANDQQAQVVAYILNAVSGNLGKTVQFLEGSPAPVLSSAEDVDALIQAMNQKQIDVLVIANSNPAYSMPPSAKFVEALRRVPFVVWCGGVPDETADQAHLLLPIHHPLETWRDTAPRAGIWGLGQPTMQPVFESRELGDLLLASAHMGGATAQKVPWENMMEAVNATFLDLQKQFNLKSVPAPVLASFQANLPWLQVPASIKAAPTDFWAQVRRDGGVFTMATAAQVTLNAAVLKQAPKAPAGSKDDLKLVAFPHLFLYDGRGADKSWLQEMPEPISQIVWDSWAQIHPDTAKALNIGQNHTTEITTHHEVAELKTDHGTVEVAVMVSEHVAPGLVALPLGQGHTSYGRFAQARGVNGFGLLPAGKLSTGVKVRPTGQKRELVSPLWGDSQMGRGIVQAMSIEELAKGEEPKEEGPTVPKPYELYPAFKYPTHQWGMTIDVNACVGCSACVAACYAENNLSVVGKEGVSVGRIMSWMRIERYVPSKEQVGNGPLMYITPMLCQQCSHAPCEPVCPVFAAYHTKEGLNGQNYNRCIGTRYCENNCPYKVRRFNWFAPEFPAPLNLQLNPDVTVRGAGVMEKCTFCVQRIVGAEINAMVAEKKLRDGVILPACAEACPTHAISFGDMNDHQSEMMQRRSDNKLRNYRVLTEFNTLPSIVYLRDLYHQKERA